MLFVNISGLKDVVMWIMSAFTTSIMAAEVVEVAVEVYSLGIRSDVQSSSGIESSAFVHADVLQIYLFAELD